MIRCRRALAWSIVLLALLVSATPPGARAEEPAAEPKPRWTPNVYLGAKLGSERMLGQVDIIGPVLQGQNALMFMDLRGRIDDDSSGEGNFGLGYRQILAGGSLVAGAYGFFDVLRSANDNTFIQGTLGLELSSEFWMGRVNGYLPEDRDQVIAYMGLYPEGPQLIGNTLEIVSGLGPARVETALGGFDVELGRRFPVFGQNLWIYGAYYRFSKAGLPTVEGPRVRAEVRFDLSRWLSNAVLALGGEWETDDVRGSQGFGTLEFRYAFGGARARGAGPLDEVPWQDRRMVGRVVRDVDVITGQTMSGAPQTLEPAYYPDSETPVGSVVVVANCGENCSSAPGTVEAPNDLATGVGFLESDSILLVQGDLGNVPTEGVTLSSDSQRLSVLGGGVITTVESASGQLFRYALPGSSPTLELAEGSTQPILSFAAPVSSGGETERDFLIAGIDFLGGGLKFDGVEGRFVLQNLVIDDSRSRGFDAQNTGADFSLFQVEVNRSADEGVWLSNLQGDESRFAAAGLRIDNGATQNGEGEVTETYGPGFVVRDAKEIAVTASLAVTTGETAIDIASAGADPVGVAMLQGWLAVIADDAPTGIKLDNVRGTFDVLAAAIEGDGTPESVGISMKNSQLDSFLGTASGTGDVTIVRAGTGISLDGMRLFDDQSEDCETCGRVFVQGDTTISDTTGSAVRVSNSEAPINFLSTLIENPGDDGIVLTDNTGDFRFGGSVLFDAEEGSDARALVADLLGGQVILGAPQVSDPSFVQDLFFEVDGALLGSADSGAAVLIKGADRFGLENPQFSNIGDQASEHALQVIDVGRYGTAIGDGAVLVFTDPGAPITGFSQLSGSALVVETAWGSVPSTVLSVFGTQFSEIEGDAVRAVIHGPAEGIALGYETIIQENVLDQIGGDGIAFEIQDPSVSPEDGSLVFDYIAVNNILNAIGGTGIRADLDAGGVETQTDSVVDFVVTNNGLTEVEGNGISVSLSNGPSVALQISNNDVLGTAAEGESVPSSLTGVGVSLKGVALAAEETGRDADIAVTSNIIRNWGQAGVDVNTQGDTIGGDATALIAGNDISDTAGPGVRLATGADLSLDVTVDDNDYVSTGGIQMTGASISEARLGVDLQDNLMEPTAGDTSPRFRFESSETVRIGVYCDPAEPTCPSSLEQAADFKTVLDLGQNGVNGQLVELDQIETTGTNFEVLDTLRRVDDGDPDPEENP